MKLWIQAWRVDFKPKLNPNLDVWPEMLKFKPIPCHLHTTNLQRLGDISSEHQEMPPYRLRISADLGSKMLCNWHLAHYLIHRASARPPADHKLFFTWSCCAAKLTRSRVRVMLNLWSSKQKVCRSLIRSAYTLDRCHGFQCINRGLPPALSWMPLNTPHDVRKQNQVSNALMKCSTDIEQKRRH